MFKRFIKLFKSLRPKSPLALLELKLVELKETDLRNAAEHAYALAMLYKNKGDAEKAIKFGRECIELFNRSKLRTQWDSVPRNVAIESIAIPDPIHQEIVREHLKPLSLFLAAKAE